MTRIESVRHAADRTKDSVRHAADVVAPYASTAKDSAVHYADEARQRLAPKVSSAAQQARATARTQYDAHLAARVDQARAQAVAAVPPGVQDAVGTAAQRTRETARQAADYAAPRVEQAVAQVRAAAGPAKDEAVTRSAAAVAALRSHVTAGDIEKLDRRLARRARNGRIAKRIAVLGIIGGAGFAAWRWWSRQTNPDWLVEPAPATEVSDADRSLTQVDGSPVDALDPEVQAKQAEADAAAERRNGSGRNGGETYP
ncbi:DUF5324 family protein [Streptomyces sp. NBC_01537]|uniref:DUF5324 family protein n=1 Tax=Streptomyces sp. NBC_01537 TaxID=2903896 RepID=UPI003869AD9C